METPLLTPEHRQLRDATRRIRLRVAALCIVGLYGYACLSPESAHAQGADAGQATRAQQQYELDIAICNTGGFPAPQREACIREAGQRLDRSLWAATQGSAVESVDGRATVVLDPAGSSALRGEALATTPDGRANVVVPSSTPR